MIKLSELDPLTASAPALAARIAAEEAHRAKCTAPVCHVCERRPPVAADPRTAAVHAERRAAEVERVLAWIPPAYAAAELTAEWLVELAGRPEIDRAGAALSSPRVALIGPPGSGKTSLAAAMYRAAARAETSTQTLVRYRWVSAHQLAKARAGHPLGGGEAPLVEACLRAPLLVLDELGGEDPRHASAVGEVLYERHAEQRATWVTTGVGSKEIAARYGGGIARRVFEGATVFRLGKR